MSESMLELTDYSKLAEFSTPIPIGDIMFQKKDQLATMLAETFDIGDNSFTSTIPKCECGSISGLFYIGATCQECGSQVVDVFVSELRFKSRIHIPDPIPEVLHPNVYRVLCYTFSEQLMRKILDPNKRLAVKYAQTIPQGYVMFRKNFRPIVNELLRIKNSADPRLSKDLNAFLDFNEDKLWVRDLPILDKSLQHITEEKGARSHDDSAPFLVKAMVTLSEMLYKITNDKVHNDNYTNRNIFEMYDAYMGYVNVIMGDKCFGKEGLFRKHLLGARYHFSARAVIVPICEKHQAEEVHFPWRVGVRLYELEIYNLLLNRYGYHLNEAFDIYRKAEVNYCPIVDEIFGTLTRESPFMGLPALVGRNPSLRTGAAQMLYCTKIKTDVHDKSMGFSTSIVSAPNADYDGVYIAA